MQPHVLQEMLSLIDRYFPEDSLRLLLHSFAAEKAAEQSPWSLITRYTHLMLGGQDQRLDQLCALTEMIILALDIADDLQDQDNPDKPWMQQSPALALNGVLGFLSAALGEIGCISERPHPLIAQLIAQAIRGQHQDLANTLETEAAYIQMARHKSGSLMRLACHMGCLTLGALDAETLGQLNAFADSFGLIAQLSNDIGDLVRYDLKNDLLARKRTFPILFLLRDCAAEFPPLHDYYEQRLSKADFILHKKECLQYIEDSGCLEYTRVVQTLLAEQADAQLASIRALPAWKAELRKITIGKLEED